MHAPASTSVLRRAGRFARLWFGMCLASDRCLLFSNLSLVRNSLKDANRTGLLASLRTERSDATIGAPGIAIEGVIHLPSESLSSSGCCRHPLRDAGLDPGQPLTETPEADRVAILREHRDAGTSVRRTARRPRPNKVRGMGGAPSCRICGPLRKTWDLKSRSSWFGL